MSTLDSMLERNKDFAARQSAASTLMPSLPRALPNVRAIIIGCADMRVDPAHVLGIKPGEAVVIRNIGGRITPGLLEQLGLLGRVLFRIQDQLSQWRGYSHGSSGVSLGLRLKAIRPPADLDTLVCFAPCVYKPADKKALLSHSLAHFVKEVRAHWDATREAFGKYDGPRDPAAVEEFSRKIAADRKLNDLVVSAVTKTRADLLRTAALIKDESFHEEAEWRLVLPVLVGKSDMHNPPLFRAGTTTLVPYIAYPLASGDAPTLPLVDLILGPGSHPSAIQAAFAFLTSEGIRVMPRESKVPYRPF